ncbi:hypothetical protein ACFLTH_09355 [Bacteroidota bacterium]
MCFKNVMNLIKKHKINFSKFTVVGIIASLLNIFFVWFFIDIMFMETVVATTIVVGAIFFLKFYLYNVISLIKKQFLKYAFIQVISALLNIFFTWLFIDIFLIPTIIATILVVGGLFLTRFVLFNITKLIR